MNFSDFIPNDSVLRAISNATGGFLAGAALTMFVLAIPIAVSLFASYRLGWRQSVSSQSARFDLSLVALPIVALGLWVWSLAGIDTKHIADIGLIASLPLVYFAALMVLAISFGFLLLVNPASSILWLLHVGLLILMLHGTLPILYEVPRFPWVYKHIGVTSYIQIHNGINPGLDAYHNWPGFFGLGALWTEALGLKSSLEFAKWAQLFFNLIYLGPLLMIYGALSRSRQAVWVAAWFFFMTSWVSQDYFAPQAFNFFLFLVVMAVVMNWLAANPEIRMPRAKKIRTTETTSSSETPSSSLEPQRHPNWYFMLMRQAVNSDRGGLESEAFQRHGLTAILVLTFAVIVSSHQLTPFMLLAGLTALTLWRRTRYPWLPLVLGVLVVAWGLTFAKTYTSGQSQWYSSLGQLFQNLQENTSESLEESQGRVTASLFIKIYVLFIWGLAALGGIQQMRRGVVPLRAILLAAAPFPIILLNSYGGEMLLRIYFFSLPFMTMLITGALPLGEALETIKPARTSSWRIMPITAGLSLVIAIGFICTYTAKEKFYRVNADEVTVLAEMYQKIPPESLIILMNDQFLPIRLTGNYEQFFHLTWVNTTVDRNYELNQDDLQGMREELGKQRRGMAYLIFSDSQRAFFEENNILNPGNYDRFKKFVARTKPWKLEWRRGDVEVYSLRNPEVPLVPIDPALQKTLEEQTPEPDSSLTKPAPLAPPPPNPKLAGRSLVGS